jgi:hypothetical protein
MRGKERLPTTRTTAVREERGKEMIYKNNCVDVRVIEKDIYVVVSVSFFSPIYVHMSLPYRLRTYSDTFITSSLT